MQRQRKTRMADTPSLGGGDQRRNRRVQLHRRYSNRISVSNGPRPICSAINNNAGAGSAGAALARSAAAALLRTASAALSTAGARTTAARPASSPLSSAAEPAAPLRRGRGCAAAALFAGVTLRRRRRRRHPPKRNRSQCSDAASNGRCSRSSDPARCGRHRAWSALCSTDDNGLLRIEVEAPAFGTTSPADCRCCPRAAGSNNCRRPHCGGAVQRGRLRVVRRRVHVVGRNFDAAENQTYACMLRRMQARRAGDRHCDIARRSGQRTHPICGDSANDTVLLYIDGKPGTSLRNRSEYRPIPQAAIAPASAALGSCTRSSRSLVPAIGDSIWLLPVRAFSKIALTPSVCSLLPVSSSLSPRRAAGSISDSVGRTQLRLGPAPANATGPRSSAPRLSTGSATRVAASDSINTTDT